jgi:transcriptional regulator with XRE-family HTH domain
MPAHAHSAEFADRAALFCAKVRQAYDEQGLTQLELVERTSISQGYLKLLLNKRGSHRDRNGNYKPANPTLDVIIKLADALDLDIAYLVDPDRPVEQKVR